MNILVTGGAGFIGSHLVQNLLENGHKVTTLDDLSTGKKASLESIFANKNHQFVQGSVLDRSLLNELMEDCDAIFHLAAVLGVKKLVEEPLKVIESNIDGTRNILELASSRKLKVIFASTSEVYGKNSSIPYHENADRVLGSTTKNRWCYATAKALDEHLCFAYAEKGLPVTIIRYFNVYGPRATTSDYGMVVPKFIIAALQNKPLTIYGSGEQTRSFTYIDDAIKGTVKSMNHQFNSQVFNIGNVEEISIKDLANKIKRLAGSSSDINYIPYEKVYGDKYEDIPNRIPDNSKAEKLLDFVPSISIEQGLKKTIKWYKKELFGS